MKTWARGSIGVTAWCGPLALGMALACLAQAGAVPAGEKTWDFEGAAVNATPEGISAEVGTWKVVAADGGRALMQQSEGDKPVYNIALVGAPEAKDVDLAVRFLAVSGEIDRGGGLVWRAKDAKNYYVARYNPLEDNLRLYTVVDGKRTQLRSADVPHSAGWHTLRVTMKGDQIACCYDGKKSLEARDSTFPDAGRIGLWSKADARTQFDDLTLREP
jgi:hypothetical protein